MWCLKSFLYVGYFLRRKHRASSFTCFWIFCLGWRKSLCNTGLHMVWESQTAVTNDDAGDGNSFLITTWDPQQLLKKHPLSWADSHCSIVQKGLRNSLYFKMCFYLFQIVWNIQNMFCICVTTYNNKWYILDTSCGWLYTLDFISPTSIQPVSIRNNFSFLKIKFTEISWHIHHVT